MEKTYLVITGNMSWGKGVTEKEALEEAHKARYNRARTEYPVSIYRFPPQLVKSFRCSDSGGASWEWADGVPESIKTRLVPTFHVGNYMRGYRGKLIPVDFSDK